MALTGPKPLPTALKIIRGNPGKRTLPKNEPRPRAEAPACPDYVESDQIAKATWDFYLPILMRMRVLTEADGIPLANLALTHSFLVANLSKVRELNNSPRGSGIAGMVIPTKTGYFALNQLYGNVRDAMKQELEFCRELGLTPSSRTRVPVVDAKPDKESPWESV